MANSDSCIPPRAGPRTKPNWAAGRVLTAEACRLEQTYRLQKFRRHNRELHGWGVLCGLWVVPAVDGSHPWGVRICPGYAIGPYGDEIELLEAEQVNIEDHLWSKPQIKNGLAVPRAAAYVAVRYQDWSDGLALVPGGPCNCKDPEYRDAYIADGHQAAVIWTTLRRQIDNTDGQSPDNNARGEMCRPESPQCPPCPDSPWVTLARVILPERGVPLTAAMIDNSIRNTL